MKELRVTHKGKPYKVRGLNVGGTLWLHANGETYVIESPASRGKSSGRAASIEGSGQILAPMPGKILKVKVASGDSVGVGQVLVVMEAMKMEYSLSATIKGRVKALGARDGDQVELNQVLVEIEEVK